MWDGGGREMQGAQGGKLGEMLESARLVSRLPGKAGTVLGFQGKVRPGWGMGPPRQGDVWLAGVGWMTPRFA